MASATPLSSVSLGLHPKLFQEFQPMGGVAPTIVEPPVPPAPPVEVPPAPVVPPVRAPPTPVVPPVAVPPVTVLPLPPWTDRPPVAAPVEPPVGDPPAPDLPPIGAVPPEAGMLPPLEGLPPLAGDPPLARVPPVAAMPPVATIPPVALWPPAAVVPPLPTAATEPPVVVVPPGLPPSPPVEVFGTPDPDPEHPACITGIVSPRIKSVIFIGENLILPGRGYVGNVSKETSARRNSYAATLCCFGGPVLVKRDAELFGQPRYAFFCRNVTNPTGSEQ